MNSINLILNHNFIINRNYKQIKNLTGKCFYISHLIFLKKNIQKGAMHDYKIPRNRLQEFHLELCCFSV